MTDQCINDFIKVRLYRPESESDNASKWAHTEYNLMSTSHSDKDERKK